MHDFYSPNIMPQILKTFKVKNAVISGLNDKNLTDNILKYNATFTQINTNDKNCLKGNPLEILSDLENYDTIFISDDSNWYTVFNELKIIKKTNNQFPLVFICNSNFPNKRRDSYINPDIIPADFRQKYTKELPVCYNNEKIIISDGFFHACDENTPKNGVLTAVEDFLKENSHIGMMKINFLKEICILYPKSQINQKRISVIKKNIRDEKVDDINISDKLIENQLLISYIDKYKLHNENLTDLEVELSKKDSLISDYENKIRTQSNEIMFKESQLSGAESNLSLKDSQIKNIESKLVNRDRKINNLENQLSSVNSDLDYLNQEVDAKDTEINDLEAQLETMVDKSFSLSQEINHKNNEIDELKNDFKHMESNYNNQINSLNDAINQKEQILINNEKIKDIEISSLKDDFAQKEKNLSNQINSLNEEITQKDKNHAESIKIKDSEINSLNGDFAQKESNLNSQIRSKNESIKQKDNQINSLNEEIIQKDKYHAESIKIKDSEINSLKNDFTQKENNLNSQIHSKNESIKQKNNQIKTQQQELDEKNSKIHSLEHSYTKQLSKIDNKEYCISCYKDEISNNHLEITYLKNKTLTKKILSPVAYLYLILKSNPKEISLNMKLYKALKDSKCFDIGFYLNNNKDLIESKWCEYFSPELHYVCNGFGEKRLFNKKYFNRNSKNELLEYLLTCEE